MVFKGCGFGGSGTRIGELVFSTGMIGYPEALTDPSYRGQILILTNPLIGNYGVPCVRRLKNGLLANFESESIQVEGLVISNLMPSSHWSMCYDLDQWLRMYGTPGIYGVDTRYLVKLIRDFGTVMAAVVVSEHVDDMDVHGLFDSLKGAFYDDLDLVDRVTIREPILHNADENRDSPIILVVDCGVKHGILRNIVGRGYSVARIPCKSDPTKYIYRYDRVVGIVYSNGPGNPIKLDQTISYIRSVIELDIPILGICLGHQLISLALGCDIFKLKYGHRGHNKSVINTLSNRCYISTHNHGYAVGFDSVRGSGFRVWFIDPDDRIIEGLIHRTKPIITTQFHPEASPGPNDTTWIFDLFIKMIERRT